MLGGDMDIVYAMCYALVLDMVFSASGGSEVREVTSIAQATELSEWMS